MIKKVVYERDYYCLPKETEIRNKVRSFREGE